MLQSLFNLPVFANYFENSDYLKDLHPQNKGVARAFGSLVSKMKSGATSNSSSSSSYFRSSGSYENPKEFKSSFSRACRKFSGYSQEDAQEFLVALLEIISSDLNQQRDPAKYKELNFDKQKPIEVIVGLLKEWWLDGELVDFKGGTGERVV